MIRPGIKTVSFYLSSGNSRRVIPVSNYPASLALIRNY
jgi:hypothetical protein